MKKLLLLPFALLLIFTGCTSGFTSAEWKEHNDLTEVDNPRYHMTDDLQQKFLKKDSTSQEEVLTLLGEPAKKEENEKEGTLSFYYPIGWNTTIETKQVFFVVIFGQSGKYSASSIFEQAEQ